VGIIICPRGTSIATQTLAETEATWTTLINSARAARVYPFPKWNKFESPVEDTIFFEGDVERLAIREGNVRMTATYISLDDCRLKAFRSFNGGEWSAYFITEKGFIFGKSSNGTLFEPFDIKLHTANQNWPATGKDPYMTKVFIDLLYPEDWTDRGISALPTAFDARNMEGLTDCILTTSEPSAAGASATFKLTVTTACEGAAVTGLVATDILLKIMSSSVNAPIATAVDTLSNGVYLITCNTTAVAHTVYFKNQPAMTTKGYEDQLTASVTFS
jgi:hypothetical protein